MSSVVPKSGSYHVTLKSLIDNGLYKLYPQLQAVNERRNPRLHLAVEDLRQFGFETERPLTKEKIDVAARIAFVFKDCVTDGSSSADEETFNHLLAWFLSLEKRPKNDPALQGWLEIHSNPKIVLGTQVHTTPVTSGNNHETAQYADLVRVFENRIIHESRLSTTSSINPIDIAQKRAEWGAWKKKSKDQHRTSRDEGRESPHRRKRTYRARSHMLADAEISNRRVRREVDRDQYRASRAEGGRFQYQKKRYDRRRSPVRSGWKDVQKDGRRKRSY